MSAKRLDFQPLTPDRWDDLERLFGPGRGGNSGCWCMWWRLKRPEWSTLAQAGAQAGIEVARGVWRCAGDSRLSGQ